MCVKYLRHVPIKQIFRWYSCQPTHKITAVIPEGLATFHQFFWVLRNRRCRLLVVGGGTGGCSVAWRLKKLFKEDTIVLEPSEVHYYQPGFTLIGTGLSEIRNCTKLTSAVLPKNVSWIQDSAELYDPCNNSVRTKYGRLIEYDYMVISVGLENNYSKIKGLLQALEDPYSKVCSLYSPVFCQKTWCLLQQFCGGEALFTFPDVPGKCSGASLKIAYLAQDYWRMRNLLNYTRMTYNTATDGTMTVPIYSVATRNILLQKGIGINYCFELKEVHSGNAVFMDNCGMPYTLPYDFLHVTPPMVTPDSLFTCKLLVDARGFLDVDPYTLQHKRFKNVFGLGDCTSTPNNKTAAAVALQSLVLAKNLNSLVYGKPLAAKYNGYGACPIVTSYTQGILAEYLYGGVLAHTFPFDQTKERAIFLELVLHLYPIVYWKLMMKGMWSGPQLIRKIINPFGLSSTETATASLKCPKKLIDFVAIKKKVIRMKENIQLFLERLFKRKN